MEISALPRRAFGRSLVDFEPLHAAEKLLLAACAQGRRHVVGDSEPKIAPETPSDENRVRAAFLRFLLLGGDHENPIHEHGVQITGAYLTGELDLAGAETVCGLYARACRFEKPLKLVDCQFRGPLHLAGSHFPGIEGARLRADADINLNRAIATRPIRLAAAQLRGSLFLRRSKIITGNAAIRKPPALFADLIGVGGDLDLSRAELRGAIRLAGAKIDGRLQISGGRLDGEGSDAVSAHRAEIAGGVSITDRCQAVGSINFAHATITGPLALSGLRGHPPILDLTDAKAGTIRDETGCWGQGSVLNGFVYGGFTAPAATDAKARIEWLDKQPPEHRGAEGSGEGFRFQPWHQLQKVLREMGHLEDARQVAIALEERRRRCGLVGQGLRRWWTPADRFFRRFLHLVYGKTTGYGWRPLRLVYLAIAVWFVCGGIYTFAAHNGYFAPSNPAVFQNAAYKACADGIPATKASPPQNWYFCQELPGAYTGFSPLLYSLNVLLPVIDLQQESAWGPITPTPSRGWRGALDIFRPGNLLRLLIWLETLFGWFASLLLIAVLSGLARRHDE